MNGRHICVFDFETGGVNVRPIPGKNPAEPLQLAAAMLHPRTLKVVSTFESLMKPLREEEVHPEALKVNNLTLEQVRVAPHPKFVWKDFSAWVKQHQKKNTVYEYPIAAGYNIRKFDMHIVETLCKEYGPTVKDRDGYEHQGLFSSAFDIDLMDEMFSLTEDADFLAPFSDKKKHDIRLTTIGNFMGLTFNDAHTALGDVYVTSAILVRLLKMKRSLMGDGMNGRAKFHNAFNGATAKQYLDSL